MASPSNISWRRAIGTSCLAVYGPFVAMALYATFFVSCSHCKQSAWSLLPWAPGLVAVEMGRHWGNLPRLDEALAFALAFIATLSFIAALALVIRRGPWPRYLGVTIAVALSATCAFMTLAMIRA